MNAGSSKSLTGLVVTLGALGVLGGCKAPASRTSPQGPVVRTAQAVRTDSAQDLIVAGTLEAETSVGVSFQIPVATVQKVLVSEGESVRQGQVLAVMDAASLRDQLSSAQAKARQAEDAWNRLKPMHENGTIPEIKWVEVETDREQARSLVSQSERAVGDAVLRAPMSGIVARRSVEPGEMAPVALPAFTLVRTGTMSATVPVAEKDVARLRKGGSARVSVSAVGRVLEGRIREIGIQADPLSRTYKVKVAIPNPGGLLRVGMVAEVRLRATGGPPALVVPAAAVLVDADERRFVWVESDKTVRRRTVGVSGFLSEGVAIDSGLVAGERVVVSGTPMLADGLHVRTGN